MDERDVFLVDGNIHEALLEQELTDIFMTVESMLLVSYDELSDVALSHHQQRFLQAVVQQVALTKQIYHRVYGVLYVNESRPEVFHLNPDLNNEKLSFELTSHIYQLNSLCYLSAFVIFADVVNDHLVNTLTVINNCTKKMVRLIDLLNLRGF